MKCRSVFALPLLSVVLLLSHCSTPAPKPAQTETGEAGKLYDLSRFPFTGGGEQRAVIVSRFGSEIVKPDPAIPHAVHQAFAQDIKQLELDTKKSSKLFMVKLDLERRGVAPKQPSDAREVNIVLRFPTPPKKLILKNNTATFGAPAVIEVRSRNIPLAEIQALNWKIQSVYAEEITKGSLFSLGSVSLFQPGSISE